MNRALSICKGPNSRPGQKSPVCFTVVWIVAPAITHALATELASMTTRTIICFTSLVTVHTVAFDEDSLSLVYAPQRGVVNDRFFAAPGRPTPFFFFLTPSLCCLLFISLNHTRSHVCLCGFGWLERLWHVRIKFSALTPLFPFCAPLLVPLRTFKQTPKTLFYDFYFPWQKKKNKLFASTRDEKKRVRSPGSPHPCNLWRHLENWVVILFVVIRFLWRLFV